MNGRKTKITEEQRERLATSWQARALLAAEEAERSHGDPMFRILCAALKLPTEKPPWWGPTAVIIPEKEGERDPSKAWLWSNWLDAGSIGAAEPKRVCTVMDLYENLNRLADVLRFSDPDRLALFEAVSRWVVLDERDRPEDRLTDL